MDVKDQVAFQGRQSYCDVDEPSKLEELLLAAEKLLEFQPTFSKGSTGYIRQERLTLAIRAVREDLK